VTSGGATAIEGVCVDADRSPTAFAAWVSPHLPAMARLAARLVGSADRDDVVQDALGRAWRKWGTYDERRGTARTWLLAIVAGESRRPRWRRWPTRRLDDVADVPGGTDAFVDVDLERAIRDLPARMRLAIDCVYFVGLSVAETAAVMGVTDGTVKSTLHDARQRLRTTLEVSE
jgi:RNA polymerase sigma factor (sigma-70 family)